MCYNIISRKVNDGWQIQSQELVLMSHAQNPVKGGVWLSVADAITIMLAFGSFVLLLVGTVVILVRAILDNQKDRH